MAVETPPLPGLQRDRTHLESLVNWAAFVCGIGWAVAAIGVGVLLYTWWEMSSPEGHKRSILFVGVVLTVGVITGLVAA